MSVNTSQIALVPAWLVAMVVAVQQYRYMKP